MTAYSLPVTAIQVVSCVLCEKEIGCTVFKDDMMYRRSIICSECKKRLKRLGLIVIPKEQS